MASATVPGLNIRDVLPPDSDDESEDDDDSDDDENSHENGDAGESANGPSEGLLDPLQFLVPALRNLLGDGAGGESFVCPSHPTIQCRALLL
jgi:hypothetical protein